MAWTADIPGEDMGLKSLSVSIILFIAGTAPIHAQDYGNITLKGEPTPFHPIWGAWNGNNRIIRMGEFDITLENVRLKKPLFRRDWEITFELDNHTGRDLENIEFCFAFFTKDKILLSNAFNIGKFSFSKLGKSEVQAHRMVMVSKAVWPDNPNKAALVGIGLVSLEAKKTMYEKMDEEIEQKRKLDEASRIEMEATQARIRKEQDQRETEQAKIDKERKLREKKAKLEAHKKREAAISKQPSEIQALIRKGQCRIGMNKEQVLLSWGRPEHVNKTTYSFGVNEQWVYNSQTYAYFENGILTAVQN